VQALTQDATVDLILGLPLPTPGTTDMSFTVGLGVFGTLQHSCSPAGPFMVLAINAKKRNSETNP
jgi:hypothetical protein